MKKLLMIFFVAVGFALNASAIDLRAAIQTDEIKAIQDLYELERATKNHRQQEEKSEQQQFFKNAEKKMMKINAPHSLFLSEAQRDYTNQLEVLDMHYKDLGKKRSEFLKSVSEGRNRIDKSNLEQYDLEVAQVVAEIDNECRDTAAMALEYTKPEVSQPWLKAFRNYKLMNTSPVVIKEAMFRDKMNRE